MADKHEILEVVDGFNAFYLYHNPSGRCACMGDGVDEGFYLPRLDEVVTLEDGEDVFTEAWQHDVEIAYLDYMDAYFHDLYELEIYDRPQYPSARWIVMLSTGRGLAVAESRTQPLPKWEVWPIDSGWLAAQSPTPYTDLSYDEQQAVAEALEEYEEAG